MKLIRPTPSFRAALALAVAFGLPFTASAETATAVVPHHKPALSKSRLGVRMSYTLAPLAVGSASALDVTIAVPADAAATVVFHPDAALGLSSNDVTIDEPAALGSHGGHFSLAVTPTREGLFYVNVFVRSAGRSEARAIAVQVGTPTNLDRRNALQVSPRGERVIAVPAQQ